MTALLTKCLHFEISTLGLELRVSSHGLGFFDEVSVSSRNFNQVSVSKVTVSTTSLVVRLSASLEKQVQTLSILLLSFTLRHLNKSAHMRCKRYNLLALHIRDKHWIGQDPGYDEFC